jgi:phage tail-like protein
MSVQRDRPYLNFNFTVDLGGGDVNTPLAGFSEVVLPEAIIDVVEYRNGNERASETLKLPGRARYTNFILKRGVLGAVDLYGWWNDVRDGSPGARRTVLINLLDDDRSNIVFSWKLLRAFPVRYKFSRLNGRGKRPLLELLELAFERLEVE